LNEDPRTNTTRIFDQMNVVATSPRPTQKPSHTLIGTAVQTYALSTTDAE